MANVRVSCRLAVVTTLSRRSALAVSQWVHHLSHWQLPVTDGNLQAAFTRRDFELSVFTDFTGVERFVWRRLGALPVFRRLARKSLESNDALGLKLQTSSSSLGGSPTAITAVCQVLP